MRLDSSKYRSSGLRTLAALTCAFAVFVSPLAVVGAVGTASGGDTETRAVPGSARGIGRPTIEPQIKVDQFGYLPQMSKVAVIADPMIGFDSALTFTAGTTYQVRDASTGRVVFRGSPTRWRGGKVDKLSGDAGWRFDFTKVTEPGTYYLYDVANRVGSAEFSIGKNVYDGVLDAALKAFWYNRANVIHKRPWARRWPSAPVAAGPGQDSAARSVDRPEADTARDLGGGWFDGGDTNKSVTSAMSAVHQLLSSWERYPEVFDDRVGIPESGNGIPDIVDEVMVELEWLEKMQLKNGGVLSKVGFTDDDDVVPASSDVRPRFYEEICSSSTIAAAGMFAHAALALGDIVPQRAARWQRRAIRAWNWYQRNEIRTDCDPQTVKSGDADLTVAEQGRAASLAGVYLVGLTGRSRYSDVFFVGLPDMRPWIENAWNLYEGEQADALLAYTGFPNADPGVIVLIEERMRQVARNNTFHSTGSGRALYPGYLTRSSLVEGSNQVSANLGVGNMSLAESGVRPSRTRALRTRSEGHLHSLHGVNPLSIVYLSNMYRGGAERSINQLYHYAFQDGTRFDDAQDSKRGPAPGFLVGGPNRTYSGTLTPPLGQPPLKAYLDFNTDTPEAASDELSEPSISYQAAYIRLLAAVIAAG